MYVGILEHFDMPSALAVTTYKLLWSRCRGPLVDRIMSYLSCGSWRRVLYPMLPGGVLRMTLYVLIVHARMFNVLEVPMEADAAIERLPSLDEWAETAFSEGGWRMHPMVVRG